jgi:purine-binding chemotaxis protein CheW
MMSSYLLFLLAERMFGVKLVGALEILPWRASRPVPLSYSYVEGLLDYRGTIYPVYNLVKRLGLKGAGPAGSSAEQQAGTAKGKSIILLEDKGMPFAIAVDAVAKMTRLEEQTAAPEKIQGIDPRYIKGTVNDEGHEIMILDFERLFHAG